VLSRESGVWDELAEGALGINPFDVVGTAEALAMALNMERRERAHRAARLRTATEARSPHDWLEDQLKAARTTTPKSAPVKAGA
jgi:trehalose 6-phosphate synthase